MDAFFTIIGTAGVLIVFAALSVLLGSDTRDDFSERTLHASFR